VSRMVLCWGDDWVGVMVEAFGFALAGEADVDEGGLRLTGDRVLGDFKEISLAGEVVGIPSH